MFTGIVAAVGRIARAEPCGDGLRLRVEALDLGLDDVAIGDSIAIQGACHTVVAKDARGFEVDSSRATLAVTTGLEAGLEVNLEKSLRLSERLGGHLVQGHVDGVGTVAAFEDAGGSWRLAIDAPAALAPYIARKGSVAVDGVSLTVNALPEPGILQLSLIEFTWRHTTLGTLAVGDGVHIEADMLGKYVRQLVAPYTLSS